MGPLQHFAKVWQRYGNRAKRQKKLCKKCFPTL